MSTSITVRKTCDSCKKFVDVGGLTERDLRDGYHTLPPAGWISGWLNFGRDAQSLQFMVCSAECLSKLAKDGMSANG